MTFSTLPTETVLSILFESIPESFESLALTCKRFYAASTPYIANYNVLRNKYRRLVLNDINDRRTFILQLFLDISHDPVTARYVEYADLRTVPDQRVRLLDKHQEDIVYRILVRLFEQSQCLGSQNEPLWAMQVCSEQNDPFKQEGFFTTIALLGLLPNVKHLTLPRGWSTDMRCVSDYGDQKLEALCSIIQNANDKSKPYAGLSNLTTLFPAYKVEFHAHTQFSQYLPFLAINSVRELYCTSLAADIDNLPVPDYNGGIPVEQADPEDFSFSTTFPSLSKNLERVELGGSCLDLDEFTEFFERAPALKVFKYSFQVKNQEHSWSWNPAKYVSTIEAFQGENLEELSISIAGDGCRQVKGSGIKSLKGFEKLKTLELDLRVLLGRRYNDPNSYYPEPEIALAPCKAEIPTLLELLPPSIETLHLMIDQVNGPLYMSRLVEDFKENHKELLPNLSSIDVRCSLHNKQGKPSDADAKVMSEQNRIWVNPMLRAFGLVEKKTYSEDLRQTYYDTDGYSEALFMRGLREMVGRYP